LGDINVPGIVAGSGRNRLVIYFVTALLSLGVVAVMKISSGGDPPSCAKGAYADNATGRNGLCDAAIDEWCFAHHPEAPEDCSNRIHIDGDARNVGKD
jgi:hypothetical protein